MTSNTGGGATITSASAGFSASMVCIYKNEVNGCLHLLYVGVADNTLCVVGPKTPETRSTHVNVLSLISHDNELLFPLSCFTSYA